MTPERWVKVRDLFDSASDLEPHLRLAFLQKACAGDATLLEEVSRMLQSVESAGDFLIQPVSAAVAVQRQMVAPDTLEGKLAGPYKLLRRVGSGGMGSVYAAARVDQQFQKIVAIKTSVEKPSCFSPYVDATAMTVWIPSLKNRYAIRKSIVIG